MDSISPTCAGDALTNFETLHFLAQCNNRASRGIAKRHWLVEAIERGLCSVHQTFTTRFLHHLFDEIGTRARFAKETLLGKFHDHALGSGRDQTCFYFDKCLPLTRGRHGYVFNAGFPSFDVLKELFHCNFILRGGLSIPQEIAVIYFVYSCT